MDNACDSSLKYKDECYEFIIEHADLIVNLIQNDKSIKEICIELNFCKNVKTSVVEPELAAAPECILCEQVVKEVVKRVNNHKSRDDIKNALEHACERLYKIQNKCTDFIDKHGDLIVDLIMKELTPKAICRELGFCLLQKLDDEMETDEAFQFPVFIVPSKPIYRNDDIIQPYDSTDIDQPRSDTSCVVCQTVVAQLEKELKDKKTQAEIENTIKNICHSLPKKFNAECSKFVDDYATLIINLIDTTPPKELCGQMNLCAPPPRVESKGNLNLLNIE